MDLVKDYKENTNYKSVEDIFKSLSNVFMFGSIKSAYKSEKTIKNKEEINELTIQFLENILNKDLAKTKQEKLTIISLLDEMNYRNEVLQLMENEQEKSINKAAKSIGKKFTSSVEK